MSSRRTRCNYDSIKPFFFDKISDFLLTIRSTGVDNSFCMRHSRRTCNLIRHLLNIDSAGDISSAMTDNYAYFRFFSLNVFFRRQDNLHHLSPPAGSKQCHAFGSCTACLYYSFRNIFRPLIGSGNIDTVPAACHRPQF